MAFRFRELPWYLQTFLFFVIAVGLFLAGELLSVSPVKAALDQKAEKDRTYQTLVAEVSRLQAVRQQHQEFLTKLKGLEDQLTRSRDLVPDKKQTDDFIRLLQGSALGAQVSIRRLTAKSVVFKDFYAEMPFEVELDGPYYNVMDFFARLAGSTRIVNAGAVKLGGIDTAKSKRDYTPGTTVAGTCIVTTYYTPSDAELAAQAPPKR